MGGRIAEQVRRALVAAAKVAPVAVVIDASGCGGSDSLCGSGCVFDEPPTCPPPCKRVPVSGSYRFGALALVFPFDAMPSTGPGFHGSHLCEARAPFLVELPLESCKELADPRYVLGGKYSDNDTILSCSAYSVEFEMGNFRPPSGCFPTEVNCVAEYPPGATACNGGADAATDASTTSTDASKDGG
jgi:hypothetical protein